MSKTNIKIIRGDGGDKHIINGDIREGLISPISMYELTISSKAEVVNPTQLKFSQNNTKYKLEISPANPSFNNQNETITLNAYLTDSSDNYLVRRVSDVSWYINDEKVGDTTRITINESNYNDSTEYQGRVELYVKEEYVSQTFTITNKVVELLNSIDVNIIAQNGTTFDENINELIFTAETKKDNKVIIPDNYEWYINKRKKVPDNNDNDNSNENNVPDNNDNFRDRTPDNNDNFRDRTPDIDVNSSEWDEEHSDRGAGYEDISVNNFNR